METTSVIATLLGTLLAPPGIVVLIALLGFILYLKWPLLGAALFTLSIAALIALSLPITGHQLLTRIETYALPVYEPGKDVKTTAQAIVVLGAGRSADAPEYQGDTVDTFTLERLRYAAYLHRKTGLPILVSGGSTHQELVSQAELMRAVLVDDFHVNVKFVEDKSRNTLENARYTQEVLQAAGINQVYVVTHAWHMRRALWSFQSYGIAAIPTATGFSHLGREDTRLLGYLPSARGMRMSSLAIRERIGYAWYTFKQVPDNTGKNKN